MERPEISTTPATVTVSVPIALPCAERIEEIIREEARAVAERQLAWLTFDQAAAHMGISPRTFERKKKELGLPVSIIDGVKRVARADVDALMRAHLHVPTATVIAFPSVLQRDAERGIANVQISKIGDPRSKIA